MVCCWCWCWCIGCCSRSLSLLHKYCCCCFSMESNTTSLRRWQRSTGKHPTSRRKKHFRTPIYMGVFHAYTQFVWATTRTLTPALGSDQCLDGVSCEGSRFIRPTWILCVERLFQVGWAGSGCCGVLYNLYKTSWVYAWNTPIWGYGFFSNRRQQRLFVFFLLLLFAFYFFVRSKKNWRQGNNHDRTENGKLVVQFIYFEVLFIRSALIVLPLARIRYIVIFYVVVQHPSYLYACLVCFFMRLGGWLALSLFLS